MKTQLYRIPGPWAGQLAIVSRPRGGEWLEAEIDAWTDAEIDAVVSLLTTAEEWELGLQPEREISQQKGIPFARLNVGQAIPGMDCHLISAKGGLVHSRNL